MRPKGQYFRARYVRFVSQTLLWTPILVAMVAAYLLAAIPQMREVYLSLIEDADLARAGLGLVAIALFCAFLYVWNHGVALRRIDAIYPEHADLYFDRDILKIRDLKAAVVAILPIFGLVLGLVFLYGRLSFAAQDFDGAVKALNLAAPEATDLSRQLERLPGATLCAVALVLVVGIGLVSSLYATRANSAVRSCIIWISYAIAAAVLFIPLAAPEATLTFAHIIGPLAGCGAVLVTGAVLARIIAYVVRILAAVTLSVIATLLMAITALPASVKRIVYPAAIAATVALLLLLTTARDVTPPAAQQAISVPRFANSALLPEEPEISRQFGDWLARRKDHSTGKYPAFIVAAQGGGIYAASAVASFLASVQERCPQFAQHVFAISAVSGGAIGASIFNSMMQDAPQVHQEECSDTAPSQLSEKVRQIVLADHLTPIILELFPDALSRPLATWFGEAAGYKDRPMDRAGMLERSFAQSFDFVDAAGAMTNGRGLNTSFSEHWTPQSAAPALLLNATWVETGYRVAFSPFALQAISDGTLYSFTELNATGEAPLQPTSLIQSSSISARFPFILPAWTIIRNIRQPWSSTRWTFVDGGYADSSGSTTALEVYNALTARAVKDGADLYMILLTNASAEPEFSKIGSSWIDEYIAPVRTVLRVRDLLSWRAVTQARSQLGDKVIALQLEHRAFPLPLGWKISRASNALIEFMSGAPENCREVRNDAGRKLHRVQLAITTIANNSCQLRRLLSILDRRY